MNKKMFFLSTLFVLFISTTLSAAPDASQPISYSIQILRDGVSDYPAMQLETKEGRPILTKSTFGENPYTGEPERELIFKVIPHITDQGLKLVGEYKAIVDDQVSDTISIDDHVGDNEVKTYSLTIGDHHYDVILHPYF